MRANAWQPTVLLAELCAIVLVLMLMLMLLLLLLLLHWLLLLLLIGGHDAAEAGRDWPGWLFPVKAAVKVGL